MKLPPVSSVAREPAGGGWPGAYLPVSTPCAIGEKTTCETPSSCVSPSGLTKRSESPSASTSWPSALSRSAQNSSASGEPTRQTTECTIPSPAWPGRAFGYSKNVMSEPACPSSSA